MIKDQESFEAALQRVADLLDHPHMSPDDKAEFFQLVHDIELFEPTALTAPRDTTFARIAKEARALNAEATDFQTEREERERRERWSSFPEDGQGVGPTTGV
jgi:hypothetical protein